MSPREPKHTEVQTGPLAKICTEAMLIDVPEC
jgi:hypothetical protein